MKKFITISSIIIRILSEGFLAYKVFTETGFWTLLFVIFVTISIELQMLWNHVQNKTNGLIVEKINRVIRVISL